MEDRGRLSSEHAGMFVFAGNSAIFTVWNSLRNFVIHEVLLGDYEISW
jgi:hypothetical protein